MTTIRSAICVRCPPRWLLLRVETDDGEVGWGEAIGDLHDEVEQALTATHTIARELVTTTKHTTEGEIKIPGIPFRFSHNPATIRNPPPSLGEHTDEVLEELGRSIEEISELRDSGAI